MPWRWRPPSNGPPGRPPIGSRRCSPSSRPPERSATSTQRAAELLRDWNTRRSNSAWEQLGRNDDEIGESPASAFRRLRLEMLEAERQTFIDERDNGRIDDEVLRTVMRGLDLEEATLNRG